MEKRKELRPKLIMNNFFESFVIRTYFNWASCLFICFLFFYIISLFITVDPNLTHKYQSVCLCLLPSLAAISVALIGRDFIKKNQLLNLIKTMEVRNLPAFMMNLQKIDSLLCSNVEHELFYYYDNRVKHYLVWHKQKIKRNLDLGLDFDLSNELKVYNHDKRMRELFSSVIGGMSWESIYNENKRISNNWYVVDFLLDKLHDSDKKWILNQANLCR